MNNKALKIVLVGLTLFVGQHTHCMIINETARAVRPMFTRIGQTGTIRIAQARTALRPATMQTLRQPTIITTKRTFSKAVQPRLTAETAQAERARILAENPYADRTSAQLEKIAEIARKHPDNIYLLEYFANTILDTWVVKAENSPEKLKAAQLYFEVSNLLHNAKSRLPGTPRS